VTSSCKVTSKSHHLIVGRANRDSICVLSKVDLWFSCLEYYYLPFLDFSDTVCYFLQEELIAAVAQHFAAQVKLPLPLNLLVLFVFYVPANCSLSSTVTH
jgi:hypothetical protein